MDRTTTVTSGLRTPIIFLMVLVPGILSQAAPSNPTISSPTVNTIEEGTVTFTCETEGGSPTPTVKWYKDNTLVDDTSFTDSSSGVSIHKNIYSANIQFSDKNVVFKCEVENSATSSPLTVTKSFSDIYVEPSSPVLQGDSAVQAGVSESWACYTNRSYPIPTITWNLDSQAFSQGISTSVSQNSDATYFVTSILTFTPVSGDNNKVLMCEIEHSQTLSSSIQRTITLQITGGVSKPAMTIQQTSYSATSGSQVTLQCTASGATSFSWLFNGTNVANNPSLVSFGSLPSPSLTILSMSSGNIGSYVCRGTNSGGTSDSPAISLSLISLPTVTVSQTSYNIVQGNTVTLACTVSGATNIFWQKIAFNGQTTTLTIDNSNYGGSSVGAPSLVIYNIDSNDQATYVCNGQNTAGTTTGNQITLIVSSGAPILSTVQTSYSVSTGTTVTLSCSYSSSTSVSSVYWQVTKGGTTTAISTSSSRFSGATVSAPSLQISSTQTSDSGSYRCFAVNTLATGAGNPITLTVSGGSVPTVTAATTAYSSSTGSTIELSCSVSGSPAVTSVFWQKLNTNNVYTTLSIDGTNYGGSTTSNPNLLIYNTNSGDSGSYLCKATNSLGTSQSAAITVSVSGNVPSVSISQSSYTTTSGSTVTLICSVSGSPAVTNVFWQRNINGVTSTITIDNSKYGGSTTSSPSLVIYSAASSDNGLYRCFATNSVGTGQSAQTTFTVTGSVPTVSVSQTSYSVSSGTTVTLACSISANPVYSTVYWQRNIGSGTQTITIDNINFSGSTVSSPSLTVISASSSDSGSYRCFATNSVGTGQSGFTTLTVSGNLPAISISQSSYSVSTGTSITLSCSVSANPGHTSVYWQRNVGSGTQSVSIDNVNFSGATVSSPSLTVITADTNDAGTYTCYAVNSVGTGQSGTITLSVTGNVPSVSISQSFYSVTSGTSITLSCSVSSNPGHTSVFWQRIVGSGTQSISIDNTNFSGATVSSPSLNVISADSGDSGTYRCFAVNAIGTGQSSAITLSVSGSTPAVSVVQSSYSINSGSSVTLGCSVSGNPSVTSVFWQRNVGSGTQSVSIDNVNFSGATVSSPSLTVITADTNDAGTYTCYAVNSVGTGQSGTITLSVTGNVPSVSISQSAYSITSGTSITLSCSVSSNPGHTSVFWQRIVGSGTQSISIDNTNFSGATVSSPSLTVISADSGDSGTYRCFATNAIGTGQSSAITLSVSGSVPAVSVVQSSYSINSGSSITLGCSVSGNPSVTSVFWQRNVGSGTQSVSVDNVNFSGATVSSPSLTVITASSGDAGSYTCFASNSVGTGQSTTTLSVSGNVPTVSIAQSFYSVSTGTTVTLTCSVSASPTHTTVYWQRNIGSGSQSVTIDNVNFSGATVSSPSLTVISADSSDSGSYTCFATNSVGTGQSGTTTLTVSGNVPSVAISQSSYSVTTGTSITLSCSVSATPSHTSVFWQRNVGSGVQSITIDNVNFSGATVSSPSLTVITADASDSGSYTCFAVNSVGTGQSGSTTLSVTGSVPTVIASPTSYTVTTGNNAVLQCSVSANPAVTNVFWQKLLNNVYTTLTMGTGAYSGSTTSSPTLTVLSANSDDAGSYLCKASNSVGTGQSSVVTLTVSGSVPSLTVTQSSYSITTGNSVTLQCSVSANPTITSVYWQRIQNGATAGVTVDGVNFSGATTSNPSLTVITANPGDSGTYTCFAINSVGTGQSSQISLTVTGNLPVVTIGQTTYSVNTNSVVTLQCSVSANPAITSVVWQRSTGGTTSSIAIDGSKYSGGSTTSPTLVINNVASTDSGTYVCQATNSIGTGIGTSITLSVTGSIPAATISQTDFTVVTGLTKTIPCTVSGTPSVTSVGWRFTHNGVTSTLSIDGVNYGGSLVSNPALIVYNADNNDQGYYTCTATNSVGTGTSSATYLYVTGTIPVVVISQSSYSVLTSNTVTIDCSVSATPVATAIAWQRIINGVTTSVYIDSTKFGGATVSSPSLTIYNSQSSDEGDYICLATNAAGTGQSSSTYLQVTGNLPTVTIGQSSYTVTTGQSLTLTCTVSASPAINSLVWKKIRGGVTSTISTSGSSKYSGATVNNPSLTISSTDNTDEGYYYCEATNAVGTSDSTQAYLSVTGSTPTVVIGQTTYSFTTGQSATLGCTVTAVPAATSIAWEKTDTNGNTNTINVNGVKYTGGTTGTPSLTIVSSVTTDSGNYRCSATNSIGTGQSEQTYLYITGDLPTVTVSQTTYSVVTGQSVTLSCQVSGTPVVTTVAWKRSKNGVTSTLTIDGSNYSGSTTGSPSLIISSVDSGDTASYFCTASNAVGTSTSNTIFLTVTGNTPVVSANQDSYSVTTGNSVTLHCSVFAVPAATSVQWERTRNSVTSSMNINSVDYGGSSVSSPSLEIYSAETSDTGVYVCRATNTVGTGQSVSITLSVTGNIPTVTIAQSSYSVTTGTTATLSCTISGIPASSIVTWQKTRNSATSTVTIDGAKYNGGSIASPSLIISNTDSNDEGSYVCQATNSVGTGSSSSTTLTVTGSVPSVSIVQNQYTVTKGSSITLQCTVSASPTATSVTWKRISNAATTVITVDGTKYSGSSVSTPSLTINSAASVDAAAYICTATNVVGVGESSQTVLGVSGDVPTVTVGAASYSVVTGSSITLACNVAATPAASAIYWQRIISGTTTTMNIDEVNYFGGSLTTPSLTIQTSSSSDEGYYICSASNSVGTGQSGQTYLTVTGGVPAVTIPQTSYSVVRGSSITIPCTVSSSPSATSIVWERIINGAASTLTIDGTKWSGGSLSVPSLTISNSATSDQAYYVCKATNSVGTGQSSQSYLTVTGSVPVATISQSQYTVVQGVSKTIDCTVSASPAANSVSWERINGGVTTTLTMDGTKFSGGQLSTPSLTIISAASSDQGYYVCTAMNSVGIGRSSQAYLTVTGSAPTVTIGSSTYTVVIGNTITLGCTFTSSPSATSLKWEKFVNGVASTITIDGTKYGGGSLSSPDLTINTAASSDQLYYKCSVSNSVGEGSSSQTYLYVTGNIPSVSVSQTSYSIGYGSSVTLNCAVTSTPAASSVFWEHTDSNGVTSTVTIGSGYQGSTLSSPSLVISSAALADQGSYYCKATNNVGTGTSSQVYLYVTGDTPNLTVGAATYSVPIGGSATLGCTITSSPAATSIFWSKVTNGASSTISTAGNSRYSGGTLSSPSLVITSLQSSDAGSYRCNAVNSVGTGQSSLTSLIATYAPQNTVVSPSSLTRDEGQTISATCTSDASPNPTFAWVKVSTNQQYGTSNTLTISSIDRGHDGDYRCTATNSQGSDTATMTVNVRYRPVSTVTSAQASVVLSSGQSQTLQCNTVSNPSVSSYSWTKDGVSLTSATSQNYIVTISASSDYGTYSCYATNAVGQSNAIPFAVSSGTTGTTSGPATGASTADTGLTSGTIAAIILAILFILLILLLVICCCCMKGVCGKKEKKKRKIEPTVIREEPKEIIRTIEIPRYVEKPFVYREPAYREPAYREPVYRETYREPSAVSRQDVVIAEENFDILKYQTVPPSGTSIDDSLEHNHRRSFRAPANLPALEYTVEATTTADDEERRRRRRSKKRRRRHREEGEGEEREHRSTSRRRHRRKRHEEVEGEPIITNGDVYYRNYSNNADTSEQYYYN
ncbi:hemicentin-1-like [Mizuhopecten yessoensis]|uniref:hemicentin-1-like n=1 Tax=Mizuhopecten yessoensis TaxID=6573 RepID=UPI000B45D87C|nr:hemicentin-1-like [Mizuhopecten yessoensis]